MRLINRHFVVMALGLGILLAPSLGAGHALFRDFDHRHPIHWSPKLGGKRRQVIYEHRPTRTLTFYLFQPPGSGNQPHPAVIYIHGGALRFGTGIISSAPTPHNQLLVALERHLIQEGIDFVSVNYRLAPLHPWPQPLDDVENAVRFVRRHGRALHINPHDMAVMGDSAGGELSSFVGLTMRNPGNGQPMIRGVVDLFGPTDRESFARQWEERHGSVPNPVYGLYTPRRVRRESVIFHVQAGAPPFLIIQGSRDRVVSPWQSWILQEKLHQCGVPVKEVVVAHAGHELVPRGGPIRPDISHLGALINTFLMAQLLSKQKSPPLE